MLERMKFVETEWHTEKNPKPFRDYFRSSTYKAWWRDTCKCGEIHEWQTGIKCRSKIGGSNCPYCANIPKKLCRCKSLEYLFPEVAKEWHPTKNTVKPNEVFAKTGKKVWWLCDKTKCIHPHEWEAGIVERTGNGQGCPWCAKNHAPRMCNCFSLLKTYPDIAKEWHPTKNKELESKGITSDTISAKGGCRVIWWLCRKGHEWSSRIADRTRSDCRKLTCYDCNGSTSFGERRITDILLEMKVNFSTQKYFNVEGVGMKFDFYLQDYRYAIEFDGDLHFRVTKFFGGEEKYKRTKVLDAMKDKYCLENRIKLLRIYWKDLDSSVVALINNFIESGDLGTHWYSKGYPIK
jgi:hypothetical protein